MTDAMQEKAVAIASTANEFFTFTMGKEEYALNIPNVAGRAIGMAVDESACK